MAGMQKIVEFREFIARNLVYNFQLANERLRSTGDNLLLCIRASIIYIKN